MQTATDRMDPARAQALCATLGLSARPAEGDPLPPFFHQVHFWDAHPPEALGRDGHPRLGGPIPDLGLPRRMWAGGRLEIAAPLCAGIPAERITDLEKAERKQGRSGPLGFVTLRHEVRQTGRLCLTEWQELVYREQAGKGAAPAPPEAPLHADHRESMAFDSTLLFRYSALTFNGHRIHYDADYARGVEGYAAPVVHGPLLAQLLALLAEKRLGRLTRFAFRATAPLTLGEAAELCWRDDGTLWVTGPENRQCMLARAG